MPYVTVERARLAEAVRHLIDAVLTIEDATEEQLGTAADAAEAAARHLGRRPRDDDRGRGRRGTGPLDYLPRSPLVGEVSPLAPPFAWDVADGVVVGRGVFHAAYEGPPGYVHGGWVALAFDEVLGMSNIVNGHPGMTGTLKVRYRRPTPLHTPVRLAGWTERVEGRRIVARADLRAGDTVTAEAEGLFVQIDPETAQRYFGAHGDEHSGASGAA